MWPGVAQGLTGGPSESTSGATLGVSTGGIYFGSNGGGGNAALWLALGALAVFVLVKK